MVMVFFLYLLGGFLGEVLGVVIFDLRFFFCNEYFVSIDGWKRYTHIDGKWNYVHVYYRDYQR